MEPQGKREELTVVLERKPGVLVARLVGELTITSCHKLSEAAQGEVGRGGPGLVVDATELKFMDSSGLGALVALMRAAQGAGVQVGFAGFSGAPRRVLEVTHLDMVMKLYPTAGAAEAALASPDGRRSGR